MSTVCGEQGAIVDHWSDCYFKLPLGSPEPGIEDPLKDFQRVRKPETINLFWEARDQAGQLEPSYRSNSNLAIEYIGVAGRVLLAMKALPTANGGWEYVQKIDGQECPRSEAEVITAVNVFRAAVETRQARAHVTAA